MSTYNEAEMVPCGTVNIGTKGPAHRKSSALASCTCTVSLERLWVLIPQTLELSHPLGLRGHDWQFVTKYT